MSGAVASASEVVTQSRHPGTAPDATGNGLNVRAFVDNFDVLADLEGGLQRLRGLVLDLAVRGGLVPQDATDGTGRELLIAIAEEVGKRSQATSEDGPAATFGVPPSWIWTTIGAVCSYVQRGKSPDYVDTSTVPVVSQKCVQWEGFLIDRSRFIDPSSLAAYSDERFLRPGDLLWNSTGHGTVGRVAIFKADRRYKHVVADTHITILRPEIEPRFLWCWLASPTVQSTIDNLVSGTTKQTELSTSTVVRHAVPLPPLAEQKRIVAKVDQLMALCDDLEARQTRKRETSTRLTKSALEALTSAEGPNEFDTSWNRVVENFDLLIDGPANVDSLRNAILALAVQGLLVEHTAADEPAAQLRDRVRTRRGVRDLAISDQGPFHIPPGWCWSRFPEIGELARGKSKHRPRNDPSLFREARYPMVQTGDVARSKGTVTTHTAMYGERGLAQSRLWPKGTLCITIAANIADSGLLAFDACFPDSVVGFLPDPEIGGARYFEFFLRTAKQRIEDFAPATAQKNINLEILSNVLVPLPPKAEMDRIVSKVERLMTLCDHLEAQLRCAGDRASRLVEAVVATAALE